MPHTRTETRRALIYKPDSGGQHPVLCFLHGYREAAADNEGKAVPSDVAFEKLHANRSPAEQARAGSDYIRRFLVVCPQLDVQGRWTAQDAGWVNDIVDRAIREHEGDPGQQILTGFSYGGEGALLVAGENPRRWRRIWAVDPAIQQRLPPVPPADARIWVDHGNAQPGAQFRQALIDSFGLGADQNGARVIRTLAEDHPGTCRAAYDTASMYDWILG